MVDTWSADPAPPALLLPAAAAVVWRKAFDRCRLWIFRTLRAPSFALALAQDLQVA
jgi:hypothetical protein